MESMRGNSGNGRVGTITRRSAITSGIAAGVAAGTGARVLAQETPGATSQPGLIDEARLLALSERLGGGASLDDRFVANLLERISTEDGIESAFGELEELDEITPETVAATSEDAQRLSRNIVQFWFLGRYDGAPVEEREELFFSMACWQPLPYATQASSCKSFGYWAVEIEL